MAVSIGFSIGWDYDVEYHTGSRVFATFYVCIGTSLIATILGYFAAAMVSNSSESWYSNAVQRAEYATAINSVDKMKLWFAMNRGGVAVILLWFIWLFALISLWLDNINSDWSQAIYFAISSYSTGGLWPLPDGTSDWHYGFGKLVNQKLHKHNDHAF